MKRFQVGDHVRVAGFEGVWEVTELIAQPNNLNVDYKVEKEGVVEGDGGMETLHHTVFVNDQDVDEHLTDMDRDRLYSRVY